MKTQNLIANIVAGVTFFYVGFNFLFNRKKIVEALLASSKVFWDKIGIHTDQTKGLFVSNIMIPVMGLTFLIVSCILIYRVIIHFLK